MIIKSYHKTPFGIPVRVRNFVFLILLTTEFLFLTSCQKFEHATGIDEVGVKDIGIHEAIFYMQLGDVSSSPSIQFGFCWANHSLPTLDDSVYHKGENPQLDVTYDYQTVALTQKSVYYMRAFTMENGTPVFSDEVRFETLTANLATVQTSPVTNTTGTTADCVGSVANDGGSSITLVGFCYNITGNPTNNDSVQYSTSLADEFALKLTGLLPATHYYVRAFAINDAGISYGSVVEFYTNVDVPSVETVSISQVTAAKAFFKGRIIHRGGAQLTDSGFCFTTVGVPTLSNSEEIRFSHSGNFEIIGNIGPANTTLYVRAFAQNSAGVGYGATISIKIPAATANVQDGEGNSYRTAKLGEHVWILQNLKSKKYADGTDIPDVTAYNNDELNVSVMGRLYTWNAAMHQSTDTLTQGACPNGWHVPTTSEWNKLVAFYGGWDKAGLFIKDIQNGLWVELDEMSNNLTDFAAPAGGSRQQELGAFGGIGTTCYFWAAETSYKDAGMAQAYSSLAWYNEQFTGAFTVKTISMSMRCLQNHP